MQMIYISRETETAEYALVREWFALNKSFVNLKVERKLKLLSRKS